MVELDVLTLVVCCCADCAEIGEESEDWFVVEGRHCADVVLYSGCCCIMFG